MSAVFERAVVLGTGLIGASLAAAGRRAGVIGCAVGVGRGRGNLEAALRSGFVDEISQEPETSLADADLTIIAAPVDTSLDLLDAVARHAPNECIVTDVGSVKQPICERATALGLAARFVGGHPMAGSAASGAAAADAELFRGRVVVLTPTSATDPAAMRRVRTLWDAVGADVVDLDPALHDRIVATSSHLPQMVAFALCATAGRSADDALLRRLTGSGFRDTTRLALSDHDMWAAIADLNRDALLEAMDAFSALWRELRDAVDRRDSESLHAVMELARRYKERVG